MFQESAIDSGRNLPELHEGSVWAHYAWQCQKAAGNVRARRCGTEAPLCRLRVSSEALVESCLRGQKHESWQTAGRDDVEVLSYGAVV